jgi:cell division septation protein DedD
MAPTTNDDAFHEIQLNGKQLVFLFMSAVVILVVVFLFGVMVGRGVSGDRGPLEALVQPETAAPVADAAPALAPPTGEPTAINEDLSYPDRLSGSTPPAEKLRAASEPEPKPAPAPARTEEAPKPAAEAPKPAAPAPTPAAAANLREPAGSGYAIQVAALRQRAEADNVARALSSKGYPAYVMTPENGAPAVFRVRVGKFKDRSEAETVAARLQKEEQFKPWIVR